MPARLRAIMRRPSGRSYHGRATRHPPRLGPELANARPTSAHAPLTIAIAWLTHGQTAGLTRANGRTQPMETCTRARFFFNVRAPATAFARLSFDPGL
jgi:hypothetical protein